MMAVTEDGDVEGCDVHTVFVVDCYIFSVDGGIIGDGV